MIPREPIHGENYREAPGSPSGDFPAIARQTEHIGPGPWQQSGTYTRRATGIAIRVLESVLQSRIRVEGANQLGRGPILFVANHFTRFETFILPYIIDKHAHRNVHSLAHWSLFRGKFGDYLRTIGAMSTKDPTVKHAIVEELLRGVNDWVIYPEGSMIKDKMTWKQGKFSINAPDRVGPPHTGAAVLALQAEIYKELYIDACRRGDTAKREEYERRFHLAGPDSLPTEPLSVVPINITYYPIRPKQNLLYRVARFMLKELPTRLEDELLIEGALLLDKTDISVYFGKPIKLDRYRDMLWPAMRALGDLDDEQKVRSIIDGLKVRLTNRFMASIYSRLTVNFDHLFCSGLRQLSRDKVGCEEFHLALFLAARGLQASGSRRRHRSLAGLMQAVIADEPYPPLDSIRELAHEEGVLSTRDGRYAIDRAALDSVHDFHDIRLKNTVAVIANEIEPLRDVVKDLRMLVNLPRAQLRERCAQVLMEEDIQLYRREYDRTQDVGRRKDPSTGMPFLLEGTSRLGVVLSHGYLASPGEVRRLAEHLHRQGLSVYVVRLRGHGTAPEHLHRVRWSDWLEAFDRGYCIMRNRCERVVCGGFSTGGLLALLSAARKGEAVAGAFAINPPLKLVDRAASLAPVIDGWNHLLELVGIRRRGHLDYVENRPEWPVTNYDRNYVHSLHELELLMAAVKDELPRVRVPSLVVQGDRDPVVDPASGRLAHERIGGERKEFAPMRFSRHCIVQGEGAELVFARIAEFVRSIEATLGREHPSRPPAQVESDRVRQIS